MNWTLPALMGAYHGLNPAMGWLFAVAMGLQQRRATAVLRALPPIALGHAASVLAAIGVIGALGTILPAEALRILAAALLFTFAGVLLARRRIHPRWVGMRLGFRDLALWSFLMSSAHGAGLMLIPVLLGGRHHGHGAGSIESGATALLSHTAAMFGVMTLLALLVYRVVGVAFLRRGWVNLDLLWIGALVLAGAATLLGR